MAEVEKFKPESLRDRISDRIRSSFVDLIPEEQWKEMVAAEITAFTARARSYGDTSPSPIQAMVRDEIKARLLEHLKAFFDTPECKAIWHQATGSYGAPEFVKDVLKELTPIMIQGFLAQMVAPFFSAIHSQVAAQASAMSSPSGYRNY